MCSLFCSNFHGDTTLGCLGVINSLSTSLHIGADTVVVAGSEVLQAVKTVNSNGVLGGVVANGSSVAGDLAISDVESSFTTDKETVTTNNSICGDSGLREAR